MTCALLYAESADMYKAIQSNVTIVGEGKIEQSNTDDVKDILNVETGIEVDGSDLSIRGVGDDGRGIAVVDDGDSQTDVSGAFSFDIDTEELEKLIVYKGPGSIYSVNGTGGVVQTKTKSVFKISDSVKIGAGSYGYEYVKANFHDYIDLNNVLNFTYTLKNADNDYQEHSESKKNKYDLKYGHFFDDTSSIEIGYNYNDSDSNKIQTIDADDFEIFKDGGTVLNDGMWIYNGDDKQIKTTNIKYKKYFNDDLLKISSFYKTTDRTQIQDGKIKTFGDNYNFGLDIEYAFQRGDSEYLLGLTYKKDKTDDNNQYKYADITISSSTNNGITTEKILSVNGTSIGDMLSSGNNENSLLGVYFKDEIKLSNRFKFEASLRIDRIEFNVDNTSYWKYDANKVAYVSMSGELEEVSQTTTLYTPRVALTYALDNTTNIYASIAQGEQTATDTQLLANLRNDVSTDLNPSQARSYEVGVKHSSESFLAGLSIYKTVTTDEIVEYKDTTAGIKYYENAGETEKIGIELSTKYNIDKIWYVGANYSYNDYTYTNFISNGVDYSGNKMEGTPDYKYALYAGFKNPMMKLRGKIEAVTSGSYYTDKANTVEYEGYKMVTNLMLGWEPKRDHTLMLNINNLFDKRYASSVTTTTDTTYTLATPQSIIVSYKYNF
jgi:iron complex outermembrane receptor protein